MRILLWAPLGAGTHYWGPGTNIYRLYKTLRNKNYHITLVHGSSQQGIFPEVFNEQVSLPSFDKGIISKVAFFISGTKWLKNNYQNYDVFHGISAFETTFHFALLFEKLGKPAFVKITGEYGGFGDNSRFSTILGIAKRRLNNVNKISGYIAISNKIVENLENYGVEKKRIFHIPNGVDTDRFCSVTEVEKSLLRSSLNIKDKLTITYLGGMTENKRVFEIVVGIKKLLSAGIDLQLLLVGPDRSNGVEYGKLKSLIGGSIIHIEFTDKPEDYLKASDIYILNSKSEGMPNSLLEAMSTRLICLSTPAAGSVDLIKDGFSGYLLDGTSNDIYEKIMILNSNFEKASIIRENARNLILDKYSAKSVLQRHLALFSDFVNGK